MSKIRTSAPDEVERVGRPGSRPNRCPTGSASLLEQALGVEDLAGRRARARRRCSCGRRRCRRPIATRWRRSSAPSTASSTTGPDCCGPAVSRLLTCYGARIPASRTRPTRCCCPATRMRSPRSCATARSAASPSSRSAGAPASSAAWIRSAASSRPWFRWTCAASTSCTALDEISGEAELGAGVTGPQAERLLGEHGFSLGHFPQSFQFATIGGFAATRSSGQDSAGYGRFNDMVRGLRAVTPAGVLDLGRAPESAAGPDLRQLLIGSEGVFGIITRVRLRVHRVPDSTRYEAWSFPDFATGRRRPARRHPDRYRTDRHPAVRRGRDRGQPRHHREHRRADASPAAAWPSRCSRARRRIPKAGTPKPGPCWRPTAARRSARRPRAPGSTAVTARRICATRCCRRARCAKRWRPPRTGPTSSR